MSMDLSQIKPTTLEGIKRLAKRLRKATGIRHTSALQIAAHQAGYKNYIEAQKQLGETDRG